MYIYKWEVLLDMPRLQRDLLDCGVTCLSEIISHYKGFVPIEQLRDDTNTNTFGTNAYELVKTLKKYNFDAYGMRLTIKDLQSNKWPLPAIAHFKMPNGLEHFIVIKETTKKGFKISDPALGMRKISTEEFMRYWDGIAIIASPIYEIPKFAKENKIKTHMYPFLKNNIFLLVNILFLAFSLSILTIIIDLYPRIILEIKNLNSILVISSTFLLIFIVKAILELILTISKLKLKQKSSKYLLSKFLTHILFLPLKKTKSYQDGEILSRVEETEEMLDTIIELVLNIILELILIIIASLILGKINKILLLLLYLGLGLYLIIGILTSKRSYYLFIKYMNQNAAWKDFVLEELKILPSTKHLTKELLRKNIIKEKVENKVDDNVKVIKVLKILDLIKNNYLDLLILFLNFYGIILYTQTKITILDFFTFQNCYLFLVYPLKEFVTNLPKLYYLKGIFTKINEYLGLKEESIVNGNSFKIKSLTFTNVCFTYNNYYYVLTNCNFKITNNFTVLQAPSGKGKSTILKILIKELTNYEGSIKVNDCELKNIPLKDIRKNIVYLSQQEKIISGSIKDNILFHEPFDAERLNKVINICKLNEFINKSSFKLDTFISDLVVSGGEKDRIILARTIYKKANLYLLDEPLSEVGIKMEMQIFNELQDFLKDKKTIYISHKALDTKNVSVVNL